VTGDGQLTAYMLVNTLANLQDVGTNLNGIYALGRNINASSVANFTPIGQFNGIFDGSGHKISGLTIKPTDPKISDIGLFTINSGTIRDLTLSNVTVYANPNSTALGQHVGTLAGQNLGMIRNVSVVSTGDGPGSQIIGGSSSSVTAGGLVGQNFAMPGSDSSQHGVIKKSSADVRDHWRRRPLSDQ
jgi:hypothetical protein